MYCYLVPSLMKNKMILNMSLDFKNVSASEQDCTVCTFNFYKTEYFLLCFFQPA